MPRTLISLGANLGNVRESMFAAGRLLCDAFGTSNIAFSQLYQTPPVGGPSGQQDFLNAVATIESSQSCWEVWETIKRIELQLGRQRLHRWEARRIDLDLLLYDDQRIWTPHLKIPHPRMCMRTFVLKPSLEVAADWHDPVTTWTIRELYRNLEQATISSEPSTTRLRIAVVSNSHALLETMRSAIESRASVPEVVRNCVDWILTNPSEPIPLVNDGSTRLIMTAVATPDPETILWEDFSRPWVERLNLDSEHASPTSTPKLFIRGPRYLLPANDIDWVVHEIESAYNAMTCPVVPTGILFH